MNFFQISLHKGTSINDVPHFLVIFDLPIYLVLLYNVPFLGLFWTPLPTLIWDVINEPFLNVMSFVQLGEFSLSTWNQVSTIYTANIYIFFTLERQWNVAKSTFINCKFSNIFEFFFTLDKCLNYDISMYFKNTMKET